MEAVWKVSRTDLRHLEILVWANMSVRSDESGCGCLSKVRKVVTDQIK